MNLETLIGATGDEWERAAVAATLDDYLESVQTYMDREYAGFVEPIVFAFRDGADWPLLGWVRCRAAWPGVDTAKAVVNMGHAAASWNADRLLVCWDTRQLAVATGMNVVNDGIGAVVASWTRQDCGLYPYTRRPGRVGPLGLRRLHPVWTERQDSTSPECVDGLLRVWRTTTQPVSMERLDAAGYEIRMSTT